jgi:hypothetical protein
VARKSILEEIPRLSPVIAGSAHVNALLAAARTEIRQATDPSALVEILVVLRTLETEVEGRQLALSVPAFGVSPAQDQVLDSKKTAVLLGTSLDWIYRNRPRLAPALVSPHDARQRYSQTRLQQLRDSWSTTDWRKK